MELVRAGWNVQTIAKNLGKTEPWVRNTAGALIAIYQSETGHPPLRAEVDFIWCRRRDSNSHGYTPTRP